MLFLQVIVLEISACILTFCKKSPAKSTTLLPRVHLDGLKRGAKRALDIWQSSRIGQQPTDSRYLQSERRVPSLCTASIHRVTPRKAKIDLPIVPGGDLIAARRQPLEFCVCRLFVIRGQYRGPTEMERVEDTGGHPSYCHRARFDCASDLLKRRPQQAK
jgi:hypothetical protein